MINTNRWNRIRYTLYSPFYDWVARIFEARRKQSIEQLNMKEGSSVLLVGAGTGLDLEVIPKVRNLKIVATDITPAMVDKIKERAQQLQIPVDARIMDGQQLSFEDNQFDHVILHLIIAVLPDPIKCIKEVERVLKPGGTVTILDKFLHESERASIFRRMLNVFTNLLFSDINRKYSDIVQTTNFDIKSVKDVGFGGNMKVILLQKPID